MEHQSFSPDLAPSDFWLFPKIKSAIKGQRYQDIEDDQKKVISVLETIPQQEFQKVSNSGSMVGLCA
jgi:hypothetical protein